MVPRELTQKLTTNFFQFHLNATAMLHQVDQANQDLKAPMVLRVTLVLREAMVNLDLKDHRDHLDHQANREKPDPKDLQAIMVYRKKVLQAQPDHQANLERRVLQVQQAHRAVQEKMVNQAVRVLPEILVHQVLKENQADQVPLVTMVLLGKFNLF